MQTYRDGRPAYNGVWPVSPRGSLTTLLSLPQSNAAFGTILSTLAWVDQSPISQRVSSNPQQGVTSTIVTTSHMTQGRVEYESTIPQGTNEGLELWETGEHTASFSGAVQDVSSLLHQNTGTYTPTHVTVHQKNKMCIL
jgi:hypothetical protein